MDLTEYETPKPPKPPRRRRSAVPFYVRYQHIIRDIIILLSIAGFYGVYRYVPFVPKVIDKPIEIAVSGITVAYGKLSSLVFDKTGFDFGFVTVYPDPEFDFNVRLATYVNEKRARLILDMAMDGALSPEKRKRALQSLLKFDATADWVQPFLNELPKGGMPGLYDKDALIIEDLIQQIKKDGGIQQDLVRAYAEVVVSFLLQHSNPTIRRHGIEWTPDLLSEDAIFPLLQRCTKKEDNPDIRAALEASLYRIESISDPLRAQKLLTLAFQHPAWPGLQEPLSYLISKNFPHVSPRDRRARNDVIARRKEKQREDRLVAMRQQRLKKEQEMKQIAYATAVEKEVKPKKEKIKHLVSLPSVGFITKINPFKKIVQRPAAKKIVEPVPPVEVKIPTPVATPVRVVKIEPTPEPEIPKPVAPRKKVVPVEKPKEDLIVELPKPEPVAKPVELPPPPPPPQEVIPPPKAKIGKIGKPTTVDMVYEVEDKAVTLYLAPGGRKASGVVLPPGTKGQSVVKVMVGDEEWFQVTSKKGKGWALGAALSLFDMGPQVGGGEEAAVAPPAEEPGKERTFFEPSVDIALVYKKPSISAPEVGLLQEGVAYLAKQSDKVNGERWFLVEVRPGFDGWVKGTDLQLADVQQSPSQPTNPNPKKSKK